MLKLVIVFGCNCGRLFVHFYISEIEPFLLFENVLGLEALVWVLVHEFLEQLLKLFGNFAHLVDLSDHYGHDRLTMEKQGGWMLVGLLFSSEFVIRGLLLFRHGIMSVVCNWVTI